MAMIFGDFQKEYEELPILLALSFHTGTLKVRWAHSAAIADFFAAYLVNNAFMVKSKQKASDLRHTIAYLVNELSENAVKFNKGNLLNVKVVDSGTALIFTISNGMDSAGLPAFSALLNELNTGDPGELLIQRIEENALSGKGGSGIGFLTLMNDYSIELSWKIEQGTESEMRVHTMACLKY